MAAIPDELIDQLLQGYKKPENLLGQEGIFQDLTKCLVERALDTERETHLGYSKPDPTGRGTGNSRNGKGKKTVKTKTGELGIETPRDYNAIFAPEMMDSDTELCSEGRSQASTRDTGNVTGFGACVRLECED